MPYCTYRNRRVHYIAEGEGNCIVFLPGNTASSAAHVQDVQSYSGSRLAASLDFIGTGASERISPWPAAWWDEGAGQTAALIEHLGCGKAVLVGASGGAVIALKTALMFPGAVRGLVADSFALEFSREMLETNVLRARAEPGEDQAGFWCAMHGSDWQAVVEEDTRMIHTLVEEQGGRWFPGGLSGITCPVLITASRTDTFLPDPAADLTNALRQIPQASLYLHRKGDHPLMWTAPAVFSELLETFLQDIGW
jgi:pimeloyl-ACP methyl ester carboxylesterase